MKRITMVTLILFSLAAWGGVASADGGRMGMGHGSMHQNGQAMMMDMSGHQMVQHYAAMARTLSQDSTEGLAADAAALSAALTPEGQDQPMMAASPLATLQKKDLDLKQARAAFKELSDQLVPALETHMPRDAEGGEWAVYHCDMEPGSWVQEKGKVHNPYYGSKMLRCGQMVGMLGESGSGGRNHESGQGHDGHHGS